MLDFSDLPTVNAALNSTTFILLVSGFIMVKKGNVTAHKAFMISATIAAILFLISYLTYHLNVPVTIYPVKGIIRSIYFSILITHILMAIVLVPMVAWTITRVLRNRVEGHKRLAKFTLPLWLFVSVTGVVVYVMLFSYYP